MEYNFPNNNKDEFNFSYLKRFNMYYEMLKYEPRIWNREHHFYKMASISFAINSTLFCFYKCYYSYYSPSLGLFDSILLNHKIKLLLTITIGIDLLVFKYSNEYLHKMIYDKYYKKVPNNEYYEMYEEILRKNKLKTF
jgi:hypothetical protein